MTNPDFWQDLPLPKRIWWRWDDPIESVGFFINFSMESSASAVFYIACSGKYRAWLDGSPIPSIEAPYPSWRVMHRIPLDLTGGEHQICVEAYRDDQQQPSLLACLDWQQDRHTCRIPSGKDWQMIANPPSDWQHNPSGFPSQAAWAFDGVWAEPWGMPCNAPDDFCRLSTGMQEIDQQTVETVINLYQGAATLNSAAWLRDRGKVEMRPPLPHALTPPVIPQKREGLEWYRVREAHSKANNIWMQLFDTRAPHIIYDTGEETFARLKIKLLDGGPAVVAVSTGESLPEVQNYIRKVTDIVKLNNGETFVTSPTGFRYVKISVLSSGKETALLAPPIIQQIRYPVQKLGSFQCSDSTLERIWEISAHTVHLCMQNEIWDGIKRDQLPWMGDLYTEALVVYHAFGDYQLARHTIAVLADLAPVPSKPLTEQRYPGLEALWKIPDGDINNIPSYTLWWLVGLADYYRYSNDITLVYELETQLTAILEHISDWVDENGIWRFRGGWDFIDWSPVTEEERATYCHLLACIGLAKGIELLESIGKSGEKYRLLREKMLQAARSAWWKNGNGSFGKSHHVNAMAIRSDVLTDEENRTLFRRTLQSDPELRMTYWHRYLDLTAAERIGDIQWGLDYIRRHWGQILQLGVTTLWEAFEAGWIGEDPHAVSMVAAEYARYGGYETSLCHGWSGGPAVWLHRAVLGISPLKAGFTEILVQPNLGDLEWAKGAIPTPLGVIAVQLEKRQGKKPLATLWLPAGVSFTVPEDTKQNWDLEIHR